MKYLFTYSTLTLFAFNSYATATNTTDITSETDLSALTGLNVNLSYKFTKDATVTLVDASDISNNNSTVYNNKNQILTIGNGTTFTIVNNAIYADTDVEKTTPLNKYAYQGRYNTKLDILSGASLVVKGDTATVLINGSSAYLLNKGTYTSYGLTTVEGKFESAIDSVSNFYGGLTLNTTTGNNTFLYVKENTTIDLDESTDSTAGTINLTNTYTQNMMNVIAIDEDALSDKIFNFADKNIDMYFTFSNEELKWNVPAAAASVGSNVSIGSLKYNDNTDVFVDLLVGENQQKATIEGFLFNVANTTTASTATTANLTLTNFDNDLLMIKDFENYEIVEMADSADCYLKIDGQYVKVNTDAVYDENSNFEFSSDGFLNYVTVPEPSTYAGIFGGLALALAIYRRRR